MTTIKYTELFDNADIKLFWSAIKSGKLSNKLTGTNIIRDLSKYIAKFLKLPNTEKFKDTYFGEPQ